MLCPPRNWVHAALPLSLSCFYRGSVKPLRVLGINSTVLWLDRPKHSPAALCITRKAPDLYQYTGLPHELGPRHKMGL